MKYKCILSTINAEYIYIQPYILWNTINEKIDHILDTTR